MATVRIGLSPGQTLQQVTEAVGSATVANTVELTYDMGATIVSDSGTPRPIAKNEVLILLELFQQYIVQRNWP